MVPLDEYVTVPEEATLFDAVSALEKAQEELDRTRYLYLHRAVLVYNKKGKIIGKVSQFDVLKALEPKYAGIGEPRALSKAGFSPQFLADMIDRYSLFNAPLRDICTKAANVKVKDFMYTPSEGDYIQVDATLGTAIHQLLMGHHQSLLVKEGDDIVGILRLTDVFKHVFQTMRTCNL